MEVWISSTKLKTERIENNAKQEQLPKLNEEIS